MRLIHPLLQVLHVLRGRRFCRGPVPTRSHLSGPGIVESKVLNSPIFCSWYFASDGRILPKLSGQMWPLVSPVCPPQNAQLPRGFDTRQIPSGVRSGRLRGAIARPNWVSEYFLLINEDSQVLVQRTPPFNRRWVRRHGSPFWKLIDLIDAGHHHAITADQSRHRSRLIAMIRRAGVGRNVGRFLQSLNSIAISINKWGLPLRHRPS